jgi:glycosyltransferase involved in cell wall biosynthesis
VARRDPIRGGARGIGLLCNLLRRLHRLTRRRYRQGTVSRPYTILTRVLIDGYALSDGSESRGIGTYLRRVIRGLAQRPELSIQVMADRRAELPPNIVRYEARRYAPARLADLEHDLRLPGLLGRRQADVFLSPAQHPPRRSPMPWVGVLHDVIPLSWPHPLLEADRRRWLKVGPRLRSASAVIAISRFSAAEGARWLGLDPASLKVIPQGVDRGRYQPDGDRPAGPPYLLHVGAWGPHKGFDEALGVIARIAEAGLPHRLLMVGPRDEWMTAQVRATVAASARPDRVDARGYVDDLATVYRGAAVLLMTSRCEGFGLPVLEAMACGTPVVAFANSSLPEVVGDAGVLVEDGDLDAMTTAVRELVEDDARRRLFVERGLARARDFSWERTVDAYASLLQAVAR